VLAAATLEGTVDNEYLGAGLCTGDLDGDKIADVVVGSYGDGGSGSPQTGRVQLVYTASAVAGSLHSDDVGRTLHGPPGTYARYGFSCAILDVNGDGQNDLVVGAPALGGGGNGEVLGNYTGAAYIYFGPLLPCPGCPTPPANVTLLGDGNFTSLGYNMKAVQTSCAANETGLALGVPFWGQETDAVHTGAVYIFRRRAATSPWPAVIRVTSDAADYYLAPPVVGSDKPAFSWFGSSVATTCAGDELFAIVGAPGYHTRDGAMGLLAGYRLTSGKRTAELNFTRLGLEDRAHYGYAAEIAPCGARSGICVVVSAPSHGRHLSALNHDSSFDMEGLVEILDFDALRQGAQDAPAWRTLRGPGVFAHLGWSLAASSTPHRYDGNASTIVFIGAPMANFEAGLVLSVSLDEVDAPTSSLVGESSLGRFGWRVAVASPAAGQEDTLVVGQPTFSYGGGSRQGRVSFVA
jgi:hypothetical protein